MIRGSDTEHRPMMMQLEAGCTCKIPCPARTEFSGPKFGHLVVCSRVNKKNRDEAEWVASVDGCSGGCGTDRTGPCVVRAAAGLSWFVRFLFRSARSLRVGVY